MKITVTIIRILTGLLFIFSGLVKAIDPLGLAYKMQEFFEVWGQRPALNGMMRGLEEYAVTFSIIMITLEVVVGVALLVGWQKRLTAWILLLLMLFFTFLTSFVLFTGKIHACGCFGDCIPLTPVQTFTKDIILTLFALIILFNLKCIHPVASPRLLGLVVLIAAGSTLYLQWHVIRHLPSVDCLPFKKGNNILELRKMPKDAVPDKYDYRFVYSKAGAQKEFDLTALPDSTWTFVERKQILVQQGSNNIPKINDFSLTSEEGADVTESIFSEPGSYFILYVKSIDEHTEKWLPEISRIIKAGKRKMYVVCAQREPVTRLLESANIRPEGILTCDFTAIKTAARSTPTLYLMNGPVVADKWGWADFANVQP